MTTSPDTTRFAPYGETRFPAHLPFGRSGYLFTISGDFPADTPAHTNVTDQEMAVYRKDGDWEVRDVNGNRRAWGFGSTRGGAVRAALAVVYRERVRQAAEIADKRRTAGLEPTPPFAVEVTNSVTLVVAPQAIGILRWIGPVHESPTRYYVHDTDGGDPYEIRADDSVTLRTTSTGILHARCGCQPADAARFESEDDAMEHAGEALTVCHPCPKSAHFAE